MEGDWLLEDDVARKIRYTKVTMTAKEAAEYLGICYPKILQLIASGNIPHIKLGRVYYFTKDKLDKWLDEQQDKPSKEEKIAAMMDEKYLHLLKAQ